MSTTRFAERVKSHHGSGNSEKFVRRPKGMKEVLSAGECPTEDNIIYVHVPFCSKICSFCNMRRSKGIPSDDYADLVSRHIEQITKYDYVKNAPIDSIYFGGGTPTTLAPKAIERILTAIRKHFQLKDTVEFSFETSLTDLTDEKLCMMRSLGVNRLSVGVQTFADAGRKLLNRLGGREFAVEKLKRFRELGIENVNIDIIYNYPYEDVETLRSDLEQFWDLDLAGFSYYSLMIQKNSPMMKIAEAENLTPEEKKARDRRFFQEVMDFKHEKGMEQMELTKIVRPERDRYKYIRHRLAGNGTFPLGAGAGGGFGGAAFMNPLDLSEYASMLEKFDEVRGMTFSSDYYRLKKITSQLQLAKMDLESVEEPFHETVENFMDEMTSHGFATRKGNQYDFTDEGVFWGNSMSAELWEKLSAMV